MKTMTFKEFKKEVKGKVKIIDVCPYFVYEDFLSERAYISNQIEEPTKVVQRGNFMGLFLPEREDLKSSVKPYFKELKNLLNIDCPVISIFDSNGEKITQLRENQL